MSFFSSTYSAIRGPTGTTQSADDAIGKLADRLSQSTQLPDRRAAVLSLKGMSRDWRAKVGDAAMGGLIEVLLNDAELDDDIAKAVLETFLALCDIESDPQLALRHADYFLANPAATHKLFDLLASPSFYTQFSSLQLLSVLLLSRRGVVQRYFITSPDGVGTAGILDALQHKRDMVRNGMFHVLVFMPC
jgi:intracellular protein transport protein USO1